MVEFSKEPNCYVLQTDIQSKSIISSHVNLHYEVDSPVVQMQIELIEFRPQYPPLCPRNIRLRHIITRSLENSTISMFQPIVNR